MQDINDLDNNDIDDIGLEKRIEMLNHDQRRVFQKIVDHLNHQQLHELDECNCNNLKPFQMFVSGVGGTGKSFLIDTLQRQVKEMWKDDVGDDTTCAVSAPTGLASFNVCGVTVHLLFHLPVEHHGKTAGYWPLSSVARKSMRNSLRSLKLVIIDEVSMLSNLNLAYIHLRLEDIFGVSDHGEWFASMNMLFVGDILQLPPVTGLPVFANITNKVLITRLNSMASVNIWKDAILYDELCINERQKKDGCYTEILNEVRCGSATQHNLDRLKERVIEGGVLDKYIELTNNGFSPICQFPTRKACKEFNQQMLSTLDTDLHKIASVDEIDATLSTRNWSAKEQKLLEKLNEDSNSTGGLEAEITLAVGARIMLRRNIDTKKGLVNGALGTIKAISNSKIKIKFDHVIDPCDIEKVKCRFMLQKTFCVYRRQFPLSIAYAVTIHKCQGLSLDCAIVDLSSNVFCAGMAYVAISRVRTLEGLFLTAFDPASIKVDSNCLQEVNRLRSKFRKDLPLYGIPKQKRLPVKRELIDECDMDLAPKKKPRTKVSGVPKKSMKRKLIDKHDADLPHIKRTKIASALNKSTTSNKSMPMTYKKVKSTKSTTRGASTKAEKDCEVVHVHRPTVSRTEWPEYRYYPIDEEWQRQTCRTLGLQFVQQFLRQNGGPDVILTKPDLRSIRKIGKDGNCLFRALCYIITGSEEEHLLLRSAIVAHMQSIPHLVSGIGPDGLRNYLVAYGYESVEEYLESTHMAVDRTWGTDFEMCVLAHLLHTPVYSFQGSDYWLACFPHAIDRSVPQDVGCKSMYIYLSNSHFEVVTSIRRRIRGKLEYFGFYSNVLHTFLYTGH